MRVALLLGALALACGGPPAAPGPVARVADTCPGSGWDDARLAASATAPFDAIDLQLDVASTPVVSVGLAGVTPFTRLPAFTLYRDGSVFYPDEAHRSLLTARLDRPAADALRREVLALGAARLESHVEPCDCPRSTGGSVCMEDGSFEILRYRDAGTLRHVVVYGGFWNDRATAARIRAYLASYRVTGATVFRPDVEVAVLLRGERGEGPCEDGVLPPSLGELASSADGPFIRVEALEGASLRRLPARLATGGRATWCTKDATVQAYLYPTLPGMDHRAQIATYLRQL